MTGKTLNREVLQKGRIVYRHDDLKDQSIPGPQ